MESGLCFEIVIKSEHGEYGEERSHDADVGKSPEDEVFFSRQLLILCDSKGPYLARP